jgi:hypothetical protein
MALIEGMPKIATAINRSESTVRRWHKRHGFPLAKLPNGNWATSQSLIDNWILSRDPLQAGIHERT